MWTPEKFAEELCAVQPIPASAGMIFGMAASKTPPRIPLSLAKANGWCLELHKDRLEMDK